MTLVILVSRSRGQQQRCYPAAHRVALMSDRLVNADTGEVITVCIGGRWYRQGDFVGDDPGHALAWEFPMIVDGVQAT